VLVIEAGQELTPNLILGARNLHRVELLLSNEVHAYDVLKAERVVVSQAALEALQGTLKKTISKRKHAQETAEVA
jgi:large subunit ribosomal protein L4